jgi:hypothetical protein
MGKLLYGWQRGSKVLHQLPADRGQLGDLGGDALGRGHEVQAACGRYQEFSDVILCRHQQEGTIQEAVVIGV